MLRPISCSFLLVSASALLTLAFAPLLLAAPPAAPTASIFVDSGQELASSRGNTSRAVALGDLNGDGHVDAVVAQGSFGSAQENVIWLNNGDGIFAESEQFIGSGDSRSVALADLDGDGDLDIIIANAGSAIPNDDEIWINQGGAQGGQAGVFVLGQSLANGESFLVKVGDLDGDGDLDAIIVGAQGVQIWWNDGNGNFSAGPAFPFFGLNDIALGDLDGDGDLDIVMAGEGQFFPSQIFWNEWNTRQAFTPGPLLVTAGVNSGVAIADLDNDGHADIYLATSQANVVWWNNGDGFFSAGTGMGDQNDTDVALGDFNGDGHIDAFVTRRITGSAANGVWLNNGDRTFRPANDQLGNHTSFRVAVADLNGDGKLDAFVANSGPNKVWLNASQPGPDDEEDERIRPFNPNGQELGINPTFGIALGRLDNDTALDAITASFDGARIWLNGGGDQPIGRFHEAQHLEDGWGQAVALGDLDGDGDLDAVVLYFGGEYNARIWLNGEGGDPPGTFRPGQALAGATSNPEGVALVDVDNDGDLDIILASAFGSELWLNGVGGDPVGVFRKSDQQFPAATRVAAGDLNGDGNVDLVFTGWGMTEVWLNGGGGTAPGVFRRTQQIELVAADLALGDLDGDGDLDLFLVFAAGYGQNQIWLNGAGGDAPGTFRDSGRRIKNVNSSSVGLIDLDGDGDLDAFITTGATVVESQSNLIWLNNGDGTGRITEQCLGAEPSLAVALGDLTGDGFPDAFVGNFGADLVWLNGAGEVCFCIADWLFAGLSTPQTAATAPDEGVESYRTLRDQVLIQTLRGQRFARLYDTHNAEVFALLAGNATLRADALALLQAWQPLVQALADGSGDSAIIQPAEVDALVRFLDTLAAAGSPKLQARIASELARLPPLQTLVGQSMAEAQAIILGESRVYLPLLRK
ncbi:MAG: VCBS repeat-containing protein [Caldilineaceae bacterium]|nr:VCBS repeat-containing protein [Caldilineaceae bacterium]